MSNQVRKSAPIVKCPHCSHTGSARGLFTHVRLAHPNVAAKPKKATKITVHPYDIKGMGHVKETIHRIETKKKPVLDNWQHDFLAKCAAEVVRQLFEVYQIQSIKGIKTSERGYKPNYAAINGVDKKK